MYIKNKMFQGVGLTCTDGKMLHLRSRQEVDISKIELDEVHLKTMLDRGYVALRGGSSKSARAAEIPETPKSKQTEVARSTSTSEKAETSGANAPGGKETEGGKSTSKHKL